MACRSATNSLRKSSSVFVATRTVTGEMYSYIRRQLLEKTTQLKLILSARARRCRLHARRRYRYSAHLCADFSTKL